MDLETLQWDQEILDVFGVPASMMPAIKSSSEVYGHVHTSQLLRETPVAGILGDQQAATFGQAAFQPGEAKNTYGTGCFLIFNTGEEIVHSKNGLLTTLGYKLGDAKPHYALEGSIAVTGSLIQWLRDNLGLISSAPEVEDLPPALRTMAASTSCRPSPGCSHRIGVQTHAARSSDSRASPIRPHCPRRTRSNCIPDA